ncbi:hypothetical protein [Reichenbachiella ulvae]|uniref:Uncharacterized protein n=1 Tax=Reichenbachiella ulvae TaxID=2980104 RepID=A0ABT3D0H6_9BACT|nr:hypothetical protein [Reichenbachiella ulvae]MCV9389387.1 hypothetical protein [Reichenbachiella ulvae]
MQKVVLVLSLIFLFMSACEEETIQEEQLKDLNEMMDEIQTIASSVDCTDPADWAYTGYGSKACGGPVGYIAYPTTIDTEVFLDLVAKYTAAQSAYNEANGIGSDCSVPAQPTGVVCEEGEAILVYE